MLAFKFTTEPIEARKSTRITITGVPESEVKNIDKKDGSINGTILHKKFASDQNVTKSVVSFKLETPPSSVPKGVMDIMENLKSGFSVLLGL